MSSRNVVKLGEHNLNTTIDCEHGQCADPPQVIYAKNIIVPKEFDTLTLKHDVALIELSEPAKFTDYVSPVCLPTGGLVHKSLLNEIVEVSRHQGHRLKVHFTVNVFLLVAGWGYFDPDEPESSTILQVVKLPVVDIERCRKIKQLKHYDFTGGQICVGGVEGKGKQTTQINDGTNCGSLKNSCGEGASGVDFMIFQVVYLLYVKQF